MARRGRSTTIGKFAKIYQDRRVSEIREFGEVLRREWRALPIGRPTGAVPLDRPDASDTHD